MNRHSVWPMMTCCGLLRCLAAAAQSTAPPIIGLPAPPPQTPPLTVLTPIPTPTPVPTPPLAQAYVAVEPPVRLAQDNVMVPLSFLTYGLGASAGPTTGGFWRIIYFGHTADLYPNQRGARLDERQTVLPAPAQNFKGVLYVPWAPLADLFGVKWKVMAPAETLPAHTATAHKERKAAWHSVMLLQYPAAYIQGVRYSLGPDRIRVVMDLSNPTRIVAAQRGLDVQFHLAGARRPNVPSVQPVNDYLVPRIVTRSGNWQADFAVRINYSAPVHWFTLGSPPRLVVDAQRLFEEQDTNPIGGGLSLTRIRKGTQEGPVQMFVVRVNPADGWRIRLAAGGYSVMQRARPSSIAGRRKALVAVNGGFFAYDGAAVGALLIDGEWLRLPWRGRTAIGFRPDGSARVDNLQARAEVNFSGGMHLPIRDLNGWPDPGHVTALTLRFGPSYTLRAGEMAVEVKDGVVVAKPGGGIVHIYPAGFTLVASGGARPFLDAVKRGERAQLKISAIGWDGFTTALGGGPRLLSQGRVEVTALREAFRADVRIGRGPRTAMGIDKNGDYIIVVVDGRQKFYSVGLTLEELAYTMQKLGVVEAVNLDGGGSTVMAIKQRVINRPSDGFERSVSNAVLVMR